MMRRTGKLVFIASRYLAFLLFACCLCPPLRAATRPSLVHPAKPPQVRPPMLVPYRHPITVWVPSYAVGKSKEQMAIAYGGVGMGKAITHLALQFWVPTKDGGLERAGHPAVPDVAILELRDWAHAHGVRAMLCVYNGDKWDWSLARSAFAAHPNLFVKNLVAEVKRWKLDGVDVDLEGAGAFPDDKEAFLGFMKMLSIALHRQGCQLSVDSYAYIWNTPNQTWWPQLFPLVDALTAMGYEDTGAGAPSWHSYNALRKAAGAYALKLQIGVPSNRSDWWGNTALAQLQWISRYAGMGVGIWDAQLRSPAWRQPEVWLTLRGIRHL